MKFDISQEHMMITSEDVGSIKIQTGHLFAANNRWLGPISDEDIAEWRANSDKVDLRALIEKCKEAAKKMQEPPDVPSIATKGLSASTMKEVAAFTKSRKKVVGRPAED